MGYRIVFVCFALLLNLMQNGCYWFASVPPDAPPPYTYAEDALRRGDYQEAVVRFDAFLGRTDDPWYRPRALYQLAWAHYELHQYRQTLDMLNQLTAEFPNNPGPQVAALRGNAEYALGHHTNGFLEWEQAWQVSNDSDKQALQGRMEKALGAMSDSELRQLDALTTNPEVNAMIQAYLDQSSPDSSPPTRPSKVASRPDDETLPSGDLYASSGAVTKGRAEPEAELEVDEQEVIKEPAAGGKGEEVEDVEEDITVYGGAAAVAAGPATGNAPRVAAILPLTGTNREAGWDALNALRLAFLDSPNWLTVRDTAGQVPLTRSLLSQLAADSSIVAVIGPLSTADIDAISSDADRLKLPLVLLSQPSEAHGPFIVRVGAPGSPDASATMVERFQKYTGRAPTKTESQIFLVGLAVRDALSKGAVTRDSVVADLAHVTVDGAPARLALQAR